MRILITGANGQLGHELLRALDAGGPEGSTRSRPGLLVQGGGRHAAPGTYGLSDCTILSATRDGYLEDGTRYGRIDLADLTGLRTTLDRIVPDLILNAAAYTAVDRAEDEPELAQRVNGDAVGVMGAWAAQHGARVVHYSTDYVFDGTATRPWREDAPRRPLGVYGRSKLAGEIALRESGARYLLLRTAWVYAARGHNFLMTMLRLGAERDELRVVDDQIGAPTPARLIADVTALALLRWYDTAAPTTADLDGTYHLTASGQTSWCGFARAIFERVCHPVGPLSQTKGVGAQRREDDNPLPEEGSRAAGAGGCHRAPRVTAIAASDYAAPAKRPAYSVLDTSKLCATFGVDLPDWQTALDGVIEELAVLAARQGRG